MNVSPLNFVRIKEYIDYYHRLLIEFPYENSAKKLIWVYLKNWERLRGTLFLSNLVIQKFYWVNKFVMQFVMSYFRNMLFFHIYKTGKKKMCISLNLLNGFGNFLFLNQKQYHNNYSKNNLFALLLKYFLLSLLYKWCSNPSPPPL